MSEETRQIFEWLGRFIRTIEDGALDTEELQEILIGLSEVAEKLKDCLPRRWWRWVCSAVSVCLREGAQELKRKEEAARGGE